MVTFSTGRNFDHYLVFVAYILIQIC